MWRVVAICALSLFAVCRPADAAAPDGFANVPWGASQAQVAQAMAQQGFGATNEQLGALNDGSVSDCYMGTLAGAAGRLCFQFLSGTFFEASFMVQGSDGGGAENAAWSSFFSIIQSKYGAATKTWGPSDNLHAEWTGLQAAGSSDAIEIGMALGTSEAPYASTFGVTYKNQSLQQRLAGQNRNGL
ncbi:MAG: hypothetical protein WCA81_06265 [Rhizomicrobium sp.]